MSDIDVRTEDVRTAIVAVRGLNVLLDSDLARLYDVQTSALVRAMKRNHVRFPPDFAFQLRHEEWENLMCQIGISSSYGGGRKLPYVFTEQGVAMLSGVLRSERAVAVNVAIMRAFVAMRHELVAHAELARRLGRARGSVVGTRAVFGRDVRTGLRGAPSAPAPTRTAAERDRIHRRSPEIELRDAPPGLTGRPEAAPV